MPATLQILCSMAPRRVVAGALRLYEEQCATAVDLECAGGVEVARRVSTGEAVDVVVLASDTIDKLIEGGYLMSTGRTDLMRSAIAVAVRAGTTHLDVSSEQSIQDGVLGASSVSYSTGPSGIYLERLFERWGILDAIRPRIVIPSPGISVASLIAQGTVALGFQQRSELLDVPKVEVVGELPPAIQYLTTFTAAVSSACKDLSAAQRLVEFLAREGRSA